MNKRFEKLSDAELREQLTALGYPKIPITETTRGLLINRLYKTSKPIVKPTNNQFVTQSYTNFAPTKRNRLHDDYGNISSTDQATSANRYTIHSPTAYYTEPKCYQTFKKYSPVSVSGGQRMDQNFPVSDYTINSSPEMNISLSTCTEQQSHLGVVNRLLSFRDKTFRKQKVCENQLQSILSLPKKTNKYLSKSRRTMYDFISYISNQSRLNQSFKPYLLVGTFVIFFICLAFVYIFQSPNNLQIEAASQIPKCNDEFGKGDCVPAVHVDTAINLTKEMGKMLQLRSKKYRCSNKKVVIGETEFIKYMEAIGYHHKMHIWRRNLLFVKLLIKQNPQWKIEAIQGEDVNYALSIKNPLFCIFYTKIQSFFLIIGIGAIIAVLTWLSFTIYRYIKAWRMNRFNIVEQFTTDIVNELIYRASLSEIPEDREIIITHLRDKLIPLNKRSAHLKFWEKALKLLEANDSRIQFGVRICDGEEYRTMKWLGNANFNSRANGLLKKWQSPAFDYANKIVNPPTSCLKIRHMFDCSEANIPNLKQIIEAALIEKVGSRCCIQDIQIDKQSCCVYVRCGSVVDAGLIHNEINGWWFDKRLISIKFLRLQRYLARFPNSTNSAPILNQ
ncbi:inner nuclear membrane protein Man1 [Anastrepha ludens]|uniref:inner nuclear membrane protein Man1 n=1 Tax=Anastrepha ludens TaxID=28586 RepID=UPI0023B111EE|nr:inner nuclear membrane protein Man1 [Anastrepha ludens]